ncbi:MAG TPA: DUF2285 domain-containing protein [Novosphingobium sp.]|nr:DUF2285 domain-containing protein [Novosphingobium sp.]
MLVGAARQGREDLFDLSPLLPLATCHRDARGREHWLFSDGWHHIRLDLVAGTLTAAPVELHYRLVGLLCAEPPLRALDRLIGMVRGGRLLASQFPAEQRASRWAQILRVHDALVAGATHRQIADVLFDLHDVRRWRITAPSWRNRVQRLTEAARRAASVDPRLWLQGRFP